MKQLLLLGAVTAIGLLSCSKQHDRGSRGTNYVTIDTTINSGAAYQLNLAQYGDADDVATIKTQATQYTRSEIVNAAGGFAPVYYFSASTDPKMGALTEQVVIAITEGRNGRPHPCGDSTLVTINFTVQ